MNKRRRFEFNLMTCLVLFLAPLIVKSANRNLLNPNVISKECDRLARNELVLRVQPNEAVYMKLMVKRPGHGMHPMLSDLDPSYASRYSQLRIPDAYESLLLDILRGWSSNFVRDDELTEACVFYSCSSSNWWNAHSAWIIPCRVSQADICRWKVNQAWLSAISSTPININGQLSPLNKIKSSKVLLFAKNWRFWETRCPLACEANALPYELNPLALDF